MAAEHLAGLTGRPGAPRVRIGGRARRAATLIEMLVTAAVIGFLSIATAQFYRVGYNYHRNMKSYSQTQVELRDILDMMTRTARHAYQVRRGPVQINGRDQSSSATQVVLEIPVPGASSTQRIRFFKPATTGTFPGGGVANKNHIYYEKDGEVGINTVATGIQSLAIGYRQTTVAGDGTVSITNVDATPGQATELKITITAQKSAVVTTSVAYVAMRNAIGGL